VRPFLCGVAALGRRKATLICLQAASTVGTIRYRIGHVHAAELATPEVVTGFREPVSSAQILDRYTAFRFAQESDDLLF
jgi:hypothetical protein